MSTPGPHVFGDGRVGLQIITPANLPHRLPAIKSFCSGMITDLFLPMSSAPEDVQRVKDADLFVSLVSASNGQIINTYIDSTVQKFNALKVGALELNIEEPDHVLRDYIAGAVARLRSKKPNLRVRINIAPYKGTFVPYNLFRDDVNLYICEQNYYGEMSPVEGDEVWRDLVDHGIPGHKVSICYGAAMPAFSRGVPLGRVVALGSVFHDGQFIGRQLKRGIIFSDDLLADVGLLP